MSLSKSGIDTPIEKLPGKSLEAPAKSYPGSGSIGRGDHGQPELGKLDRRASCRERVSSPV